MRALFLISDVEWTARARAFVLAARGLAARGHDVQVACGADSPAHARVARSELPSIALGAGTSTAGDALQLKRSLQERGADVVFVHTDAEHLTASSALRLGRGGGAVVRRVPPFELATQGRGDRIATRIAPSGLLFSAEADRQSADGKRYRVPSALAPLGIDPAEHDAAAEITKAELGVPANARLIVCVHDGVDKRLVLTAMRTVALLAPRHPELHLAVVGAARQDDLQMHGAALGISPMMTFLGARDDELSVLRTADVGWVAADGDAAAFGALDFLALRKPVLAERTPLTEHYIADGIAGVLLAPADPPTTAAAVAAFLANDEQRATMGSAGRARLQRDFTLEAMVSGFEQSATGALQRNAHPVA